MTTVWIDDMEFRRARRNMRIMWLSWALEIVLTIIVFIMCIVESFIVPLDVFFAGYGVGVTFYFGEICRQAYVEFCKERKKYLEQKQAAEREGYNVYSA